VIPSPEEVVRFLESVDGMKHRAILMASYAAGLHVSLATHLKVTDIDRGGHRPASNPRHCRAHLAAGPSPATFAAMRSRTRAPVPSAAAAAAA
jgi:hypothetical protein